MGSHPPLRPLHHAHAEARLADLQRWLNAQEYSPGTTAQSLAVAAQLFAWLDANTINIDAVDLGVLERFTASFSPGTSGRAMVTGRMSVLRRYFLDPHSHNPRHPRHGNEGAAAAVLNAALLSHPWVVERALT